MKTKIVSIILSAAFLCSITGCSGKDGQQMGKGGAEASSETNAPDSKASQDKNGQNPWTNKAWNVKAKIPALGVRRAVTLGNKIYAASTNSDGHYTIMEYDIQSDTWTKKSGVSTTKNQGEPAVVALDGKLYLIGGFSNGKALNTLEEYDPKTDKWVRKADMPISKDCHGAAAVNGKIYALGGNTGSSPSFEAVEYNPKTDKWAVKAKMKADKMEPGVTVVNNKIYICANGGEGAIMEEYDPATDQWTTKAAPPTPRASFTMQVANGKIYAIGGCIYSNGNIGAVVRSVNEYDPSNDRWVVKGDRPGENWLMGTASYNNKIYVLGGMIGLFPHGELQDVVQVYDPKLDK